jgi:hypothetical protein
MDALDLGALLVLFAVPLWWMRRLRMVQLLWQGVRLTGWMMRVTLLFPAKTYRSVKALRQQRGALRFVVFIGSVVFMVTAPEPWIMTARGITVGTLWILWIIWEKRKRTNKGKIRPIAYRKPQKEEQYDTRVRTENRAREQSRSEDQESAAHWTTNVQPDLEG